MHLSTYERLYQQGGASMSLRLLSFLLPKGLAGACMSLIRAGLSLLQHSRGLLLTPPFCWSSLSHSRSFDTSTRSLLGNCSRSVCLHMAGCRLNSCGHLIIKVRPPGHREPVQFDSACQLSTFADDYCLATTTADNACQSVSYGQRQLPLSGALIQ